MRTAAVLATLVIGCGAAAPAPPPAPPHPARPPAAVAASTGHHARGHAHPTPAPGAGDVSLAAVVGGWHGVDDDKWEYDLDIETDGSFTQVVHQQPPRDCEQTGTVTASDGQIVRTFQDNECNHDYDGKAVTDVIITLDGPHLVLRMESDYLIRYDRAP